MAETTQKYIGAIFVYLNFRGYLFILLKIFLCYIHVSRRKIL